MKLAKLLTDQVLVRLEDDSDLVKGVVLVRPNPVRKGTILMVGPGKRYKNAFVRTQAVVGERVAFMVGATDTLGGKAISYHLQADERLIRETDILFVIDSGEVDARV